ncbi:MAG: hypothetical protein ACYC3K_01830 [Candidatus Nanopelagicales bacterium]
MLEVVALHRDDGGALAVHAMRMAKRHGPLPEGTAMARGRILGVSGGARLPPRGQGPARTG